MKKALGIGCLVLILLLVGISTFIGYKVATTVGGMAKPKDLGLRATRQQADAAQQKTEVAVNTLPSDAPIAGSIRYEGSKKKTYELDSGELTALALSHARYKYFPFRDIQIRINKDNSVEISCVADTMKAFSYATAIGFKAADLEKAMIDYKIPRTAIPVYVKGSGSVTNGTVSLNLTGGEVAGIPVPMSLVNDKKSEIIDILETGIKKTNGLVAKSIEFKDGKVHFDGMVPERKYIVE